MISNKIKLNNLNSSRTNYLVLAFAFQFFSIIGSIFIQDNFFATGDRWLLFIVLKSNLLLISYFICLQVSLLFIIIVSRSDENISGKMIFYLILNFIYLFLLWDIRSNYQKELQRGTLVFGLSWYALITSMIAVCIAISKESQMSSLNLVIMA